MRPPKALHGDHLRRKDFVQIGKENSKIPLLEWGTEDSGNEIKCYVAASPGDILSVNYDLRSGSADFVDIFVDGILRFSNLNHSCFARQRGQATRFCHCERKDNGVKKKLQVYQLEVCPLNVNEYTIEPSSANSTSGRSQSPVVGTIELRVLKEIPENGTQKQAERGPTFEDFENCLSINPSIKSDKLPPTYQLGLSKPENTKSKLRKYINESIERYYVWASFTFRYRSFQALQAAGFKVPPEIDAFSSSISSTSTSTPISSNPWTSKTNENSLTLTSKKSSLDIIMESFESKDASSTKKNSDEIVVIDDSDEAQSPNSRLALPRDESITDSDMSDNQVMMLTKDGVLLSHHSQEFIRHSKGKAKSEVTEYNDPKILGTQTTPSESSVEMKAKTTSQVTSSQVTTASQNSIAAASIYNPFLGIETETYNSNPSQDQITISAASESLPLKENAFIDNQAHAESLFAAQSQKSITPMEMSQTPEPYTGSLKGLGIMPEVRKNFHSNTTANKFESSHPIERTVEVGQNARPSLLGNGSKSPNGKKIETHIVHHGRGVITAEPVNEKIKTSVEHALQHIGRGVVVSQEPVAGTTSSLTNVHIQDLHSNSVQDVGLTLSKSTKQTSLALFDKNSKITEEESSLPDMSVELSSVSQLVEAPLQSTILGDITMEDAELPLSAKRKASDLSGGWESGPSLVDNEYPAKKVRQSGTQNTSLITPDTEEIQETSDAGEFSTSIQGSVSQGMSGGNHRKSEAVVKIDNAGNVDKPTDKAQDNSSKVEKPKIGKRIKLPTGKEPKDNLDSSKKSTPAAKNKQATGAGVKIPSKTPNKGVAKGKAKADTQNQSSFLFAATSIEESSRKLQEMKAAVARVKAERERLLREVQQEEEALMEAETRELEEEFEQVQHEIDELNALRRSVNQR